LNLRSPKYEAGLSNTGSRPQVGWEQMRAEIKCYEFLTDKYNCLKKQYYSVPDRMDLLIIFLGSFVVNVKTLSVN
jgi:hypothetical protein